MTKTFNFALIVAGALVILATVLLLEAYRPLVAQGSSFPTVPTLTLATTTTSVSVTTSVRVLATTSNPVAAPGTGSFTRAYTVICNPNANPVYLNLDGDKAAGVGAVTAIIAAAAGYNACFELTGAQMIYNGSITASSTNQTATVISIKDYVY